MQRCDFAAIMKIVRDNLLDGAFSNQTDLAETLFSSCTDESAISFEAGQVSKWMNGLLKVARPSAIITARAPLIVSSLPLPWRMRSCRIFLIPPW